MLVCNRNLNFIIVIDRCHIYTCVFFLGNTRQYRAGVPGHLHTFKANKVEKPNRHKGAFFKTARHPTAA